MKRKPTEVELRLGSWLSAALDDPKACDDFKTDIMDWFDEQDYDDLDPDFNPFNRPMLVIDLMQSLFSNGYTLAISGLSDDSEGFFEITVTCKHDSSVNQSFKGDNLRLLISDIRQKYIKPAKLKSSHV